MPRSLVLAVLFAIAAPAAAQEAIETRMTPDEFKAAGLDKLTAEELSRLNAWLARTAALPAASDAQASRAARAPGPRIAGESALDRPIESRIVGTFEGFANRREYTLENGQVWRQVDGADLPGVRLDNPVVRLNPAMLGNAWFLKVDGYNTRARVIRVR